MALMIVEYKSVLNKLWTYPNWAIINATSPREIMPEPIIVALWNEYLQLKAPVPAPKNLVNIAVITKMINNPQSFTIPIIDISRPILIKKTGINNKCPNGKICDWTACFQQVELMASPAKNAPVIELNPVTSAKQDKPKQKIKLINALLRLANLNGCTQLITFGTAHFINSQIKIK